MSIALTRVRVARGKLSRYPNDPVWLAALDARKAEYERERFALARITTT